MNELKRKHHYVWREYLRAWAENELIFTLLKKEKKVARPNLMGVAQERYFYQLPDINDEEILFLKNLISNISHPDVKALNQDYLKLFTVHAEIIKMFDMHNLPVEKQEDLKSKLKAINTNVMEDAHSRLEHHGSKLISIHKTNDYSFLETDQGLFDTMLFICNQYSRTKKRKQAVVNSFQGSNIEIGKLWNIISFVFSSNLARNLSFSQYLQLTFYENELHGNYLTCDQPVINLLGHIKDVEGNSTGFKLYYPLTPKLALIISTEKNDENWIRHLTITQEFLDELNEKVVSESIGFVFAKENIDLAKWSSQL